MSKFLGITLIVLALAIAIVPAVTDCQSQGKSIALANGKTIPMKCHWTGIAEMTTGIPLVAVGAMMIASRRRRYLQSLGVLGGILGIIAILLPNTLIGVCSSTMPCNTIMQPTLTILGSLAIVTSLGGLVLSLREKEINYEVSQLSSQEHSGKRF
jgi:hypothetical protein